MRSSAPLQSLSRVWRLGGTSRLAAIAFPVTAGALLPLQALALAAILDAAIVRHRPMASLTLEIGALAALLAIRAVLVWLGERSAAVAAENAKLRLRRAVVGTVLARGPLATSHRSSGQLGTLLIERVEAMDGYLGRYVPALVQAALLPLAFIVLVAPFDLVVAALFVVTIPLIPVFMALVGWGAEAANQRQAAQLRRLNGYFADRLRGLVTLKLLGRADAEVAALTRSSDELRNRNMSVLRIAFLSSAVLEFFAALGVAGVALYVGLGLLGMLPFQAQPMSLQLGLFCLLMAPDVYQPMRTLAAHHHDRAAAKAAMAELEADLGAFAEWPAAPDQVTASPVRAAPTLIVRDLVVPGPDGRPIVRHADLELAAGEHVALLGASGSGKSTLLEALAGLRPAAGQLSFAGAPLVPFGAGPRPHAGVLLQRPKLFAGSIADNIRLGRPDADDLAVRRAAELALVTRFTDLLPRRLDTELGENGQGLSGGEAQRVALARLYLGDPALLLLDEPTSHLDTATEAEVLRRLFGFARGRTMLIATHARAVAGMADRTIRLVDGAIVARAGGSRQKVEAA